MLMNPFSLLYALFWVFSIFEGFTFTDWFDFAPAVTLAVGTLTASWLGRYRDKQASPALVALLLLLAFWPLAPVVGLYFLAREVVAVQGQWPRVMIDDPKNLLGHTSALYDTLFSLVPYLEAFAGVWLVVFLVLMWRCKPRFSPQVWGLGWVVMGLSYVVYAVDWWGLYAWWWD